jgi:serine/threonine-protein kinase HipA
MILIRCPPISNRASWTTAIDLDDGTASLKLALEVASYFGLAPDQAHQIAGQVGQAVAAWRKVAAKLELTTGEIDRMASAFEHEDSTSAVGGKIRKLHK